MTEVWAAGEQITEAPIEQTWDPQNGWQTVRTWRGLDSYMRGKMQDLFNAGIKLSYAPDAEGPYSTVKGFFNEAGDGSDLTKALVSLWSLVANDNEVPLTHCDRAQAIPADQMALIRQFLGEADVGENYQAKLNLLSNADAKTLFTKLVIGAETGFLAPKWVLRNTAIVSKNMPKTSVPMTNFAPVGSVYTSTATMVDREQMPAGDFIFTLPDGQWLVRPPMFDQQTDGKWQVMQEFWWAELWDDFIYSNRI